MAGPGRRRAARDKAGWSAAIARLLALVAIVPVAVGAAALAAAWPAARKAAAGEIAAARRYWRTGSPGAS
jgi:hypothetical protein